MLLIQVDKMISGQIASTSFFTLMNNKMIIILASIIILSLILSFVLRFLIKRRKKNKKVIVRPITDIIGTGSEQLNELNKELKPYGFAYDIYQDVFYSIMNCWQRNFGYCRLYDETSATLSMIIDSEPIYFEYNNTKWLIEFWKGQYGITTGGEVGIYYTKGPALNIPGIFNGTFYNCVRDEDRINMAFALRKNGKLLFTRSGYHWWLTGFRLGVFSKPSELTMDIIIELNDVGMCNAFAAALKKVGYTNKDFSAYGRRINIRYSKPHTTQPISRTSFTDKIIQKGNQSNCDAFNKLTMGYKDTLDKLQIVRMKAPKMYRRVLNPGKSPLVYGSYDKIKGFLNEQDQNREE